MKRRMDNRSGRSGGEHRKADAYALLETRRAVFIRRGRRALLLAVFHGETATIDDVGFAVELPRGFDPKCFGAVPGALAQAGIIRPVGFDRTCRPAGHGRPITVWTLADRAAAERWLREHPDRDAGGSHSLPSPTSTQNEPSPTVAVAGAGMED